MESNYFWLTGEIPTNNKLVTGRSLASVQNGRVSLENCGKRKKAVHVVPLTKKNRFSTKCSSGAAQWFKCETMVVLELRFGHVHESLLNICNY